MNILRVLLLVFFCLLSNAAEAQQKVKMQFTWTPLPGAISQRIAIREVADGAWYFDPPVWQNFPNTVNTHIVEVSNKYWITVHLQSMTSATTGPTTITSLLIRHPDLLHESQRSNGGVTNFASAIVGLVPDQDYEPDNITLLDSSAIDGRIIFKTELSTYRTGSADVHLVRPPKNISEVRDPTKANNKLEHVDIKNNGSKPVTIISGTAVNTQFVSVHPTSSPAQPVTIQPGGVQRFLLWFWPLHYNFPHYDFAPDLTQPVDQFTPQAIFVTKDVAQIIVPLEGHSTFDADINYDGKVNLGDLGVLRANYLKTTTSLGWDPTADINQDGTINLGDYGLLRAQFGDERSQP